MEKIEEWYNSSVNRCVRTYRKGQIWRLILPVYSVAVLLILLLQFLIVRSIVYEDSDGVEAAVVEFFILAIIDGVGILMIKRLHRTSFDAEQFIVCLICGSLLVWFAGCFGSYETSSDFVAWHSLSIIPPEQYPIPNVDPSLLPSVINNTFNSPTQLYYEFIAGSHVALSLGGFSRQVIHLEQTKTLCAVPIVPSIYDSHTPLYYWAVGKCQISKSMELQPCCGWNEFGNDTNIGVSVVNATLENGDENPDYKIFPYWDAITDAMKQHNLTLPKNGNILFLVQAETCSEPGSNKKIAPWDLDYEDFDSCFPCEAWPACQDVSFSIEIAISVIFALCWPLPLAFGLVCLVGFMRRKQLDEEIDDFVSFNDEKDNKGESNN